MREIKLTKSFKATQRNSTRKRNERNKVVEEFQGNAMQCGSARKSNERNKVDEDFQGNGARQFKKKKSEK